MAQKKWSNPKGRPRYAMWNRPDEWIVYDSKFKRIGKRKTCPKDVKKVSPARVYGETKGTMGLKEKPKYVIHPKKVVRIV